jgi:Mce-associated membrane protein
VVLSVVLLLVAAGSLFTLAARAESESEQAAANGALTDDKATRGVIDEVGSALSGVFSYAPDDLPATRRRAAKVLRGDAAKDYEVIFAQLEKRARQQKLALTTYVVQAGVSELSSERARLLVFLDQRSQREGSEPTVVAAQLSVTARLDGGHWTITQLKAQ